MSKQDKLAKLIEYIKTLVVQELKKDEELFHDYTIGAEITIAEGN